MRSSLERTIEKGLLLRIGSNLLTAESIRICSSKAYLIRHRIYEKEYLAIASPRTRSGNPFKRNTSEAKSIVRNRLVGLPRHDENTIEHLPGLSPDLRRNWKRGAGLDLFGAHLSRFAFGGRTNVVACASDAHFHVLGNLDREISFRVFWTGFSSVQLFKSLDEPVNPFWLFLHFHQSPTLRPDNHTSAASTQY